ncbi:MAG: SocA family protein [Bryobacteraceae bacterium]|nr:SocA family protein [Bryobacteraceae bacterium]
MVLHFNERRATEAAAKFLELCGGQMNWLKLIKLLYLLDREALLRWGRPVTTDRYVSIVVGPVGSRLYGLICEEAVTSAYSIWRHFISDPRNSEVSLIAEPEFDEISPSEESLIEEIFTNCGELSQWDLAQLSRDFPEWQDPNDGAIPITYRDILRAGHKTPNEIAAIESELEALAAAEAILHPLVTGGSGRT